MGLTGVPESYEACVEFITVGLTCFNQRFDNYSRLARLTCSAVEFRVTEYGTVSS